MAFLKKLVWGLTLASVFQGAQSLAAYGVPEEEGACPPPPECTDGAGGRESQKLAILLAKTPLSGLDPTTSVRLRGLGLCGVVDVQNQVAMVLRKMVLNARDGLSVTTDIARGVPGKREVLKQLVQDPDLMRIMDGYEDYLRGDNNAPNREESERMIKAWGNNKWAEVKGYIVDVLPRMDFCGDRGVNP